MMCQLIDKPDNIGHTQACILTHYLNHLILQFFGCNGTLEINLRLERLRGLRGRMWPIILLQASIFGSLHIYQGLSGAIITGVAAVIFGWLRYRSEGNLWACVIAHIAVDVIMMSLAYAEKLGVMPVT